MYANTQGIHAPHNQWAYYELLNCTQLAIESAMHYLRIPYLGP